MATRAVKLEFGSLTDQQPVGRHPVRPWVADVLPVAFPDWQCEVVVLEVERSFWEKATILQVVKNPGWLLPYVAERAGFAKN